MKKSKGKKNKKTKIICHQMFWSSWKVLFMSMSRCSPK